jgi:hypothetical protein
LKEKLLILANDELDMLLNKNTHFIKESKLIEEVKNQIIQEKNK